MKRGTLTKFARLCEDTDWREVLTALASVPGAGSLEEAIEVYSNALTAKRRAAKAQAMAEEAAKAAGL